MLILGRSFNLSISSLGLCPPIPTACLALETLLFSGRPMGTGFCPSAQGRGPVSGFPATWRSALQPSASLCRAASSRPPRASSPLSPSTPPSQLLPGTHCPPATRVRPLRIFSHASPRTDPNPRPSASPPLPFLLPPRFLHPSRPRPSSLFSSSFPFTGRHPPPGASSPNSLGLAARPLSQRSCSWGSSACGRLISQSLARAALGAPTLRLLGSVVLKSQLPRQRTLLENYRISQGPHGPLTSL